MNNVSQAFKDGILKSHRKIQGKIIVYFSDSFIKTYTGNDVLLMKFLEHKEIVGNGELFGTISIGVLGVKLNNNDRVFDADNTNSEVSHLIRAGIKVEAFLGLELSNDNIEWTLLGTFWIRDWNIPELELFAEVQCFNRLDLLKKTSFDSGKILVSPAATNLVFDSRAELLQGAMTNAIVKNNQLQMKTGGKTLINQRIVTSYYADSWVILNGHIYVLHKTVPTIIIKYEITTMKQIETLTLASTYNDAIFLRTNGTYLFCVCRQYLVKIDPISMTFLAATNLATPYHEDASFLYDIPKLAVSGDYAYVSWAATLDPDFDGWIKRIYIPSMNVVQTITETIYDNPNCGIFTILYADECYLYNTYADPMIERRRLNDLSVVDENVFSSYFTGTIWDSCLISDTNYIYIGSRHYILRCDKQSMAVIETFELPIYGGSSLWCEGIYISNNYLFAIAHISLPDINQINNTGYIIYKIFLGSKMELIGSPQFYKGGSFYSGINGIYYDGNLLYILIKIYQPLLSYIWIIDFYSSTIRSILQID